MSMNGDRTLPLWGDIQNFAYLKIILTKDGF